MQINTEVIKQIYSRLGDDLSKEIFKNRLMYSLTNDAKWIHENIKSVEGGRSFLETLELCRKEGDMVIFGLGTWGKDLFSITKKYPWKCFVDNNPKTDIYENVPIVKGEIFFNNYQGEYIFISSRLYYEEMYQQAMDAGVPQKKIINVGKMLDELSVKQYFDLEYLKPTNEREIFVDAGSFDGMTSIYFNRWCDCDSLVYAFEPDVSNQIKCRKNFEKYKIPYMIIPKGVWSNEDTLHFSAEANGTSNINQDGEFIVEVTTIDKALEGEKVTFIKMDIEGAEAQAIMGAENIIRKNAPRLAISIYHKLEDIWEIPEIILKFNPNYKLYLRHYSMTNMETVLYAI